MDRVAPARIAGANGGICLQVAKDCAAHGFTTTFSHPARQNIFPGCTGSFALEALRSIGDTKDEVHFP